MLLYWTMTLHLYYQSVSGLCSQTNTPMQRSLWKPRKKLLSKLQSPVQAPRVALCPPLLTTTDRPGRVLASRHSAWGAVTLGEVTIHLRGSKMLAYPGKKLIFPVQQLDKQHFVQVGLWVQLLHCSQNRTRFCAEKMDTEVKHRCSIPASPLILRFMRVSLVSHQKWNYVSL